MFKRKKYEPLNIEQVQILIENENRKRKNARLYESLYTTDRDKIYVYNTYINNDTPTYAKNTQRSIHSPFYFNIIDTKASYVAGNSIVINVSSEQEDLKKALNNFKKINNFEDLELEACRKVSTCGYAGRIVFISEDITLPDEDRIKVANIEPWDTIIEYNMEGEIIYAIRLVSNYYNIDNISEVYQYTEKEILRYEYDGEELVLKDTTPHSFGFIPFFKIENNNEEMSDFARAIELVNEYDVVVSNFMSEVKAFRDSIMTVTGGADLKQDTINAMKQTGVLNIPGAGSAESKIEVKWLIKQLPTGAFETARDTLRKNIFLASQHVDFQDLSSSGNLTNVNIATQLMPLESKASKYQNKLIRAFNYQFKIILSWWNILNITKEATYKDLEYIFNFMKPVNMLDKAQEQRQLDGLMSDETRLALHPSISDPAGEVNKILEEQAQENINADSSFNAVG